MSSDWGNRLVGFCQEEDLIIANIHYKQYPIRLYTRTSNVDKSIRNQIDYININKRFRNTIKNVKSYPDASLIFSDHNPLVATLSLRLKKCKKKQNNHKIDLRKLLDPMIRAETQQELSTRINVIQKSQEPEVIKVIGIVEDIKSKWNQIKTTLKEVSTDKLKSARTRRKAWMSEEILDLMDIRRTYKNKHQEKYNEIQTEIRNKIRKAKEEWLTGQCEEIEKLEAKHDSFNMHKKIKQITGNYKKQNTSILMNILYL